MIGATAKNSSLEILLKQYCLECSLDLSIQIDDGKQKVKGLYIEDESFKKIDLKRFIKLSQDNQAARARTIENDAWLNLGLYYAGHEIDLETLKKTNNFIPTPTYKSALDFKQIRPALFLDRDGILNQDHAYVYKKEDFVFYDDVVELINWARAQDFWVFVLTNQSGIGMGLYSEKEFWDFNQLIKNELTKHKLHIDKIYFSPYHLESKNPNYCKDSLTRKPAPGMLFAAGHDFPIDLNRSIMVGDKKSDVLDCAGPKYFVKRSQYTDGANLPKGAIAVHNLHEVVEHLR